MTRSIRALSSLVPLFAGTLVACAVEADSGEELLDDSQTSTDAISATGLQGEYFADETLKSSKLVRRDAVVDFDWGTSAPATGLGSDHFSVRWSGSIVPDFTERYTISTTADDGVRLWLDGRLVIDDWKAHAATEKSATIDLKAGVPVAIRLEYFDQTRNASVRLRWSSARTPKEIIPTSALLPPGAAPSGVDAGTSDSGQVDAGATTPPPPSSPPATGNKLSFAPPSGWTTYKKVTVPASGGTLNLDDATDYLVEAPSLITGAVTLSGGRNIVWIGGKIGGRTSVPSGSYDSSNRGIRISDGADVRTVFIEGILFASGTYLSDAIQFGIRSNNGVTAVLQNIRVDAVNYGTSGTVHADVVQAWGGPRTLLIDGLTAKHATYQGLYLDPGDGRTLPSGAGQPWVTRRVNIEGDPLTGGARYLLADRRPTFTKMISDRVYITGAAYSSTDSFGAWPSSGLFQKATPPGGDWVPASLWNGTAYVSPGYAP